MNIHYEIPPAGTYTGTRYEWVEQCFNNLADFGKKCSCLIARNGHRIVDMILFVRLDAPMTNATGAKFIENASISVGGCLLSKINVDDIQIRSNHTVYMLTLPFRRQIFPLVLCQRNECTVSIKFAPKGNCNIDYSGMYVLYSTDSYFPSVDTAHVRTEQIHHEKKLMGYVLCKTISAAELNSLQKLRLYITDQDNNLVNMDDMPIKIQNNGRDQTQNYPLLMYSVNAPWNRCEQNGLAENVYEIPLYQRFKDVSTVENTVSVHWQSPDLNDDRLMHLQLYTNDGVTEREFPHSEILQGYKKVLAQAAEKRW